MHEASVGGIRRYPALASVYYPSVHWVLTRLLFLYVRVRRLRRFSLLLALLVVLAHPAVAQTTGTHTVLVAKVTPVGKAPCTTCESELGLNLSNLDVWYNLASYGALRFAPPTVVGWYEIAEPGCRLGNIMSQTTAHLTAAGISENAYNHVVEFMPNNTGCGWAGVTAGKYIWLVYPSVLRHEMGHSLGLQHAFGMRCGTQTITAEAPTNCSLGGNPFDMMNASPGAGHFSLPAKLQLGWVGVSGRPPILTALSSGVYTINTYESQVLSEVKGLRVQAGTNWYSIERRQGHTGVLVYWNTYLLDTTPLTDTYQDAALQVGQTFTDPQGRKITLQSADAAQAVLSVQFPDSTTAPRPRAVGATGIF